MKCRDTHRTAHTHSLAAFALAVALALLASLMQLLPDITAQSADALSAVPDGVALVLLDAGLN